MSTCILLGIGRFTLPVAHGQGDVERLKPLPKALHQRALLASSAQECRAISGGVRRIHWLHGCACEDQAQLHQPDVLVEFVPVVHLVEFVMHYTLWLAHLCDPKEQRMAYYDIHCAHGQQCPHQLHAVMPPMLHRPVTQQG